MPRRSSMSRRKPRRNYDWTHLVTDSVNVAANGLVSSDLFTNFAFSQLQGNSIVERIIGTVYLYPATFTDTGEALVAVGLIENDAAAAGAFPRPLLDVDFPWMFWKRVSLGGIIGTAVGHFPAFTLELDIKAKRKIKSPLDELRIFIENDDGTFTFQMAMGLRILVSRP